MKRTFFLLMGVLSLNLNSQTLLNTGFENWNNPNDPSDWYSFFNFAEKTTDAHTGNYAAKISSALMCGIAEGLMANGAQPSSWNIINGGTPINYKPSFISGFYKYTNVQAGDTATVTVILKKYNNNSQKTDTIAFGTTKLFGSANYSLFTVAVADLKPNIVPDSIIVVFQSGTFYDPNDTSANPFPVLQIDDIRIGGASSILDMAHTDRNFSTLYPNPFSQTAALKINEPVNNYKSFYLLIYDASGKEVMKIEEFFDDNFLIDRKNLAEGVYTYSVMGDNAPIFKGKFVINN